MPRLNYNETWEKQEDGSMKLIERTPRIVSDKELAVEQEPERRLAELAIRPNTWTSTEKDELLRILVSTALRNSEV